MSFQTRKSSVCHKDALFYFKSKLNTRRNSAFLWRLWHRRAYKAYGDMERHRGDHWQSYYWKKSLFLFSSLTKSVPVASYNPDCMSDGRRSILTTTFIPFMDLDTVIYLAVYGTVSSLQVFIQNILNCVPKTDEAFMGLEWHGGKWIMTNFLFWDGVSL